MKIARFFGVLFCVAGLVLGIGTAALCLTSLDAEPGMDQVPQAVNECFEAVMDSLVSGDMDAAGVRMYGWPYSGTSREPKGKETKLLWQAYVESLAWKPMGGYYPTARGFGRVCQVKALDVAAVAEQVEAFARQALNEKINTAGDLMSLYEEDLDFRPEVIDEVMTQAIAQALAQEGLVQTYECTVEVVHREDQWWFVPDANLLTVLHGNLG